MAAAVEGDDIPASDEPRAGPHPGPFVRLWTARWLVVQWVQRDFLVRYRQSALGVLWALVQPTLFLVFYGLVFVKALGVHPNRGSYLVFAFCGLAPWTFFANALNWGMPSLGNNAGVLKQVYFPWSVVPLAAGGVVLLDLLLSTAVLLVLQAATAHVLHVSTLALIPLYFGLALLVEAVVVVAALFSAFVRDVKFVVPFLLQVGFIITPIMYPTTQVSASGRWVFKINPIAQLIENVRRSVIDGHWPSVAFTVAFVAGSAAALVAAVLYSDSVERRLPDLL